MVEQTKYNVQNDFYFPLIDNGATDFESTPVTFGQGDTQISKDGAAFANTTNAPSHVGNGIYKLTLTATELSAKKVIVTIVDSATKLWEDQAIYIHTYGNASAEHAFDLDAATQDVNVTQWLGTAAATPTVAGVPEVDMTHLGGAAQSATDLKDFADAGYDPVANKVEGVKTVDTTTVNTDMRGTDNASLASVCTEARLAELDAANIPTDLSDMKGATFSSATDSLEAIRDRGDAAWTTGAGGSDRLLMVDTTIATLASQTSFTLTAGSADDDAYNNCTIVIEDATTSTQKAVGLISDYVGATKTVTLKYDPAIFTMAATDKVYILAENALKATLANRQISIDANGETTVATLNDKTGISIAGTKTTLDALNDVSTADVNTQADLAITDARLDELASATHGLTAPAPGSFLDDIMNKDSGQNFSRSTDSLEAQTDGIVSAAAIADAVWDEATSGHVAAGSTSKALTDALADTNELQGDWANGGRLDNILDSRMSEASINTTAGAVDNVTTVATTTTNTDMRGTDGANTTTPPTAAAIADAIWDEATVGHTTAATFGAQCKTSIDAILGDTGTDGVVISAATANAIADALLKRDWTGITGEAARSVVNALRAIRNKVSISGTTITVTKEDDVASAWTGVVTTDAAANNITGIDPA